MQLTILILLVILLSDVISIDHCFNRSLQSLLYAGTCQLYVSIRDLHFITVNRLNWINKNTVV